MMKLVLVAVTFIVISSGGTCRGFPDGFEDNNSTDVPQPPTDGNWGFNFDDEDQHFEDENESDTHIDEDQHHEGRKAVKGRESRKGNTGKKILMMLKKMEKNQINAGCPTGFFRCIPSNQCFKYFTDVRRNFTEAIEKCSMYGLTLAQPMYPVSVRSYIVANYGNFSYNWLGARGNNITVNWLRGGQPISNQTKAYYYNTIQDSSNYAMLMLTAKSYETRKPNEPYYSLLIKYKYFTLCELTVE